MAFKFFNRNTRGRDFVVGDIHGYFSALEMLLVQLKFDPACDRVFAVGDLIDRGSESWRLVEFINYPWFFAIRGNHEQMLLDSAHTPSIYDNWINFNGGEWWTAIPSHLQPRIRAVVETLPFALEVNTRFGRVGLVHADIPVGMSWQRFVTLLNDEEGVREQALWSRHRFRNLQMMGRTQPIEGIDLVIFGHTPVTRPLQRANICYIDTGAAYTKEKALGHLTIAEIQPVFQFHQWCTKTNKMIKTKSNNRQEIIEMGSPA